MSVKVAVRVRPFNDREKERGAKCCINMQGPSTQIIDLATNKERTFTFDYSFWSHDGFIEESNGLLVPEGDRYADQHKVYGRLGTEVLDNAWDGYHCCLFAYGQTGSGKSYSMIGYGANKGIVPIATTEIFERIRDTTTSEKWYEVCISMLEIYNECVQDLLVHPEDRPIRGLNIRESKVLGVYVQDLSKHPVDSFEAIERIMEEGNKNRSIGSTEMNKTSSRAHTIITLSFKQFEIIDGNTTERFSNINLVDLAGSERQKKTKATKDRLKEGCMINLSLTILGQVINVLAEKSMGHKKNAVVPYRDSALTRILQNALGGNSKTIMICALSPAEINYDETLNTLKYAERAKKVKNMAMVNESAQDKMIRELRNENEKLKQLLMMAAKGGTIDLSNPDILSKFGDFGILNNSNKNSMQEIQEQLECNEAELKDISTPWQEKLNKEKQKEEKREVKDLSKPHLTNLNEDSQLSGMLYYSMDECPIHIGRKNGDPKPKVIIGGIGILPNHAVFERIDYNEDGSQINPNISEKKSIKTHPGQALENIKEENEQEGEGDNDDNQEGEGEVEEFDLTHEEGASKAQKPLSDYFLIPMAPEACESIFVNGEQLTVDMLTPVISLSSPDSKGIKLNHFDRIIFGNNTIFVFKYPEMHKKCTIERLRSEKEQEWESIRSAGDSVPESDIHNFETELEVKVAEILSVEREIDWEFAQKEKMEKTDRARKEEQDKEELQRKEEHTKKMQEMNQKIEEEKRLVEDQIKRKQEEYEKQMKDLEYKMAQVEEEQRKQFELELQETERLMIQKIENMERERIEREKQQQRELEEQEKLLKERQKENESLEVKLSQLMPLINEANLCAREFERNVTFKTKLISVIPEDINKSPIEILKSRKAEIFVKVNNKDTGDVYLWDMEKFMDRLYVIRELVNTYFDTNQIPDMTGANDPFWEQSQPQLIGLGYYKLEPLAYLIDNPHTVSLIGSDQKGLVGKLEVNILPTDETGWEEPPEDIIPNQPEDLIGKRIDFVVIIEKAMDLPDNFCRDVYCEYTFFLDDQVYTTPVIPNKHRNPVFDYRYHHSLIVTENTVKYLKNNAICLKVYGYPDNEHKPFYESSSFTGNNSTMQNSNDSNNADSSSIQDTASQDFSIKEQSSKEYEEQDSNERIQTQVKEVKSPKKEESRNQPQDYNNSPANKKAQNKHEGVSNSKFDEMLIRGGQDTEEEIANAFRKNRQFAQSVYEKPDFLMSKKEQAKYLKSQHKDDQTLESGEDGGNKKGKKSKGKKTKNKKDCVIF